MSWAGATTLAYGRLREGVSTQTARDEIRALVPQLQREFDLPPNWSQGADIVGLQENMVGTTRPTLFTLFAAVAFLLLIAAANVANLLLVRNSERRHELAVRASLGATPRDLAGFLGTESLMIGSIGGLAGVGFAYAGVALLRRILPSGLPRLSEISVDSTVILAAALCTLLTSALFGLAPTLHGRAAALMERMRAGRTVAGQGARTRGAMVTIEVALALILTIGATLMGRTLIALNHVDPGLRTDHLLTMKVQPSTGADAELRTFWNTTLERIRGLPGVTSAATLLHLPTGGRKWMGPVTVEGRVLAAGESPKRTAWQSVSPDYFRTVGISLLKGRGLAETDGPSVPRVIAVNSVFADQNFPGEDPIGKQVKAGNGTQNEWATIVGVVGSVRHDSLNAPAGPEVYVPFAQRPVVATALIVRTSGNPLLLSGPIRDAIWSVDRNVPITDVRTMDDLFSASLSRQRMVLILLGLFAGMGLILSAVGIYGVVAYGVRQRLREIGIRVALGADRRSIERLVLGQGMGYAAIGVLVGLPVALGLSRLLRAMVFGIEAADPVSFALVPVVLIGVALAASWMPARRAASGDPTEVLRD
jgi:putative ABC transport system permease protein